jgi:hypothetical protein
MHPFGECRCQGQSMPFGGEDIAQEVNVGVRPEHVTEGVTSRAQCLLPGLALALLLMCQ